MCRKLFLLTSFLLVLALVSTNIALGGVVDIRISAGTDDAEEAVNPGNQDTYNTSSDLEIPNDHNHNGGMQFIGLNFRDIAISPGVNIDSAYIEFVCDATKFGSGDAYLLIWGHLAPNPDGFANPTPTTISDRPRTQAKVSWEPEEWTAAGQISQTVDISSIIQELIDQGGWAAGNAIEIIIGEDTSKDPSDGFRNAESFNGNSSKAPLLHIEFSEVGVKLGEGAILFEYWLDIGGTAVSDLTSAAGYPDSPDNSEWLDKFEGPVDWADNYGIRARGYLYPPADGDYTFWISGDDYIELYLSTDDDPANMALIAEVPGWTPAQVWDKYPEQQSAPITLAAGQKLYIEALMKEGGGGDSLTAAWAGPTIGVDLVVIDGAYLSAVLRKAARGPIPADGAVDADVLTLEWTAGDTAVSHKVYLSTDAIVDESDFLAEGQLALQFADLAPGADYYWRIDEVEADGAVIEGDVWSFTTLPIEAHFPGPDDGAKDVALDTKLSWTAGKDAIMHDVYFGTDEAAVAASDPSTFQGKLMDASFDPGPLEPFTSYYWKVDEFAIIVTNPGPVWSFESFDPDKASEPDPADGAVDVDNMPVLSWMAGETAFQHDVYLGTDADLVAASDASVSQGQLTEASFAPAEALDRGITYYWKVDVSTGAARDSVFHPGNLWSFRVVDRNTDNWAATVAGDSPAFLATFVEDGLYDIGAFSGDITYEFVVRSNPDETEASMCLIGRRQFGDTEAGLKYEQWNNTGTYGATLFGVVDLDYGVPTAPGEYTVLAFVSSEDAATTKLYVNGVQEASVDRAITLFGLVGIGYGAQGADGSGVFDDFDGALFGVAIYDTALSDDVIAKHSDSYFTPIAITDPDLLIYYDFESGEGTTVLDRSGHGNHSLFMGNPEWATGIFGGGLAIDIADLDYIETVAPLNIVSNTVTVAGWVKHDESPAGWSGILTHRGTTPGCLGLQHDGTELRYMWGADVYWSFSSGLSLPNGEWYFAALAISPEQGKLYLNGIGAEQTATNVAEHEPTNFDSLIRVGRDHNDDRIMTSLIDEVRFYNKTLTDVEILKLMGTISDVTAPGDIVKGVPDDGDWPDAETPDLATDDDTSTKYLHFQGEVEPTGFQIEPASGPSIVTGLTFTTANDAIERDPISYELSGSNESIDGPYELIASGDIVDFAQETALPRFTMNATPIMFDNDVAYKYYQVMFPTVRDAASANSMQIAEVELLGVPGPVAHWTFDEGAGSVALDSSGNGNDGTFVGDPQWVAGVIGGALEFNGDDYIDCGNGPSLQIQDAITISFWFNVDAFQNTWEGFLAKGDNSYRVSRGGGDGDATHFGLSGTSAGGGSGWFNGNAIVTGGVWHHFAGTYDGAEGRIYIDGVLDSTTESTGQINISDYNFYIGENAQATGRFLHGILDDVRIYNQALSANEVSKLATLKADTVENLSPNPSFEEDEPILDDPDWVSWCTWNPAEGAGSNATIVDTESIDGTRSLRVEPIGAENWFFILVNISFLADLDKNYTAGFWAKAEAPRPLTIQMKASDNSVDAWGTTDFELTTEWTEYTYTSEVLHTDVKLEFLCAGSEVPFWLDLVSVYEVE